ncbi:ribulose-phosphate 3-epimerase [Breznakia pachnodae]|uniref:Ribulose-phosphate 3-epimerase n=1 Tax=Breznakia pachnodae TaxID=265178 RepID=A0ABU0DYB9_9FIRM|nr:ribulose-phosphate 3-epimerase [Breznakia pachnodae]MDQ0359635.1 ribulose-phosphate 3-epimerase [Breznakia pachnodae]
MNKLLCPSMMCADFTNLKSEVINLDQAGIDMFHCDVMDGSFVPNMTMGIMDIKAIRGLTDRLIDVHLMIEDPASKVDWFIDAGADLIYIHPESERYSIKTLQHIKERKKLAGIAINPDTSLSALEDILYVCDYVLVMSVNPGFAGQKFIDFIEKKIDKLIELKKEYDFKIVLDGACSEPIIKKYSKKGVDGFILGTSALFKDGFNYAEKMKELREL